MHTVDVVHIQWTGLQESLFFWLISSVWTEFANTKISDFAKF